MIILSIITDKRRRRRWRRVSVGGTIKRRITEDGGDVFVKSHSVSRVPP